MPEVTDKQWDYLMDLRDDLGDSAFYEALQIITGRKTTDHLSSSEASEMIDYLKALK